MSDRGYSPHDAERFERTDQLNQAIDRMIEGQPQTVLNDPELQQLLALATRLRHDLPHDMPDPAFRDGLKARLTQAPIPIAAAQRPWYARVPGVAYAGAMAAVLVAAIAVGSFGILNGGNSDTTPTSGIAAVATATAPFTSSALTFAPTNAVATEQPVEEQPTSVATDAPTTVADTPTAPIATEPAPTAITPQTETPAVSTSVVETPVQPTPTAASQPALAAIPPVENDTVEVGPGPAADGSGQGPALTVSYVMDAAKPAVEQTAPIFVLEPPPGQPEDRVRQLAAALGIEGTLQQGVGAIKGRMEYYVAGDDGRMVVWVPEAGVFTYYDPNVVMRGDIARADAVEAARAFLETIDYPMEDVALGDNAEQLDPGLWIIDALMDQVPRNGYGYPLGVRLFVTGDGLIQEAKGYWLQATAREQAPLLSVEEAWERLTTGQGVWIDGGLSSEGGEFRCTELRLTYLLTAAAGGGFILQPVYHARGEFRSLDGLSSAMISVYVQAARSNQ